jgi:dTDP-glucose 4,6-dehydratase
MRDSASTTSPPVRRPNVAHLLDHPGFRLLRLRRHRLTCTCLARWPQLHFASPASPIDYLQLPIETLKVGSIDTLHALGLANDKEGRPLSARSDGYP